MGAGWMSKGGHVGGVIYGYKWSSPIFKLLKFLFI